MNDSKLDEKLAMPGQQLVRQTLKAMPEDIPSMAWRGALNERLAKEVARTQSRRRMWMFISPSVGLAAAAALGLIVFLPRVHAPQAQLSPQPAVAAPSLEAQLVASHSDTVVTQDVVGSGLTSQEVQQNSDDPDAQDEPTS